MSLLVGRIRCRYRRRMATVTGGHGGDSERRAAAERTQRAGWALMGAGWEFVSQVAAGLLIGWGIDWYFGLEHWGKLGGAIAGVLVGMWTFIRRALRIERSLGPVRAPPGGWRKPPQDDDPDSGDAGDGGDPNPPDSERRPGDGMGGGDRLRKGR